MGSTTPEWGHSPTSSSTVITMDHIANASRGTDGTEMWSELESCSGRSEEHQDGPHSGASAWPQEERCSRLMKDAIEGQSEKRRKIQSSPLKEIQIQTDERDLSLEKVGGDLTAQSTKPSLMTSSRGISRISDKKAWTASLMKCCGKAIIGLGSKEDMAEVNNMEVLLKTKGALVEVFVPQEEWRIKGLLQQMLSTGVKAQTLAATGIGWFVNEMESWPAEMHVTVGVVRMEWRKGANYDDLVVSLLPRSVLYEV